MRIHHLNCGCMCPVGGALFDGFSRGIRGTLICHCLLVESDQGLVLVDTGFGTRDIEHTYPRLTPLFVHLNQIQLYAQGLAHALGQAGGPGIVYGFGVTLGSDNLAVEPGLAIAADGRALLSSSTIQVPLPKPGATLAWAILFSPMGGVYRLTFALSLMLLLSRREFQGPQARSAHRLDAVS